jgi:peptide/nickel transport system substrate-binding protein
LALLLGFALVAAACGGDDGDGDTEAGETEEESTPTTQAGISTTVAESGGADDEEEAAADTAGPAGTLRMVEFSPVTTFDPAGSQTAQAAYLYGEYDTLTRQNSEFGLEPAMATSWEQPDPTTWVFQLRDDIVFHDGSPFDAEVAAANVDYHKNFAGNPNAAVWTNVTGAEATGDYELTVSFANPQPQFPIQMSMVMGMQISGEAIAAGGDLTRAPAGSGPWVWSEDESEAGVTEIYNLFDGHYDPADQGVERIEVTAVPDNTARLNALLTGDADIMATIRDAQIDEAEDAGMTVLSIPNNYHYILISGRDGAIDEPLADEKVRQAIGFAIDRDAYNNAICAGRADANSGIYPPAFTEWHDPSLNDATTFDQERARELLAEAGYPDGLTIQMPLMPAIQPHVELVVQMLAAVGITTDIIQINNGELGPRTRQGDWGINWLRDLLYHPANDLPRFVDTEGTYNVFNLDDVADLSDLLVDAAAATELSEQQDLYGQVAAGIIERGVQVPLSHCSQNAAWSDNVSGVVMGLNMQAPMPFGVRVDG